MQEKGTENMKKTISLLMALVLLFALTACSSKPDILGTYKSEFDITELIVTEFDGGADIDGTDLSLGNYLDAFTFTVLFQFNEDGTYSEHIDRASFEASLEDMRNAIVPLMNDLMLQAFIEEFAVYGYTAETREDVETILGMAWDDILPSALGMEMDELLDEMMKGVTEEIDYDETLAEGNYKAEDGKLYLSDGLEYEIDESVYEYYELDGDTVSIVAGVNIEENEYFTYPYVLTKVESAK